MNVNALIVSLFVTAALIVSPAGAQTRGKPAPKPKAAATKPAASKPAEPEEPEKAVTRDEAVEIAKAGVGGRLLSVLRVEGQWKVKLLTASGDVRVVFVDIRSGEIVQPK